MNVRRLILAGALAAAAILTLSTIGFAAAQTRSGPGSPSVHAAMANTGQLTASADMNCAAMDGMGAAGTKLHDQMQAAAASALGMTVSELDSRLASGKTMAEVAAEKGVAPGTLHAAMQKAHGTGMNHAGMMAGGS